MRQFTNRRAGAKHAQRSEQPVAHQLFPARASGRFDQRPERQVAHVAVEPAVFDLAGNGQEAQPLDDAAPVIGGEERGGAVGSAEATAMAEQIADGDLGVLMIAAEPKTWQVQRGRVNDLVIDPMGKRVPGVTGNLRAASRNPKPLL